MKTTVGSSRSSRGKKRKCLNDQGKGNDQQEGKSVSENLGTATEEDNVENENPCKKPKRFRRTRHSQEQIQALEALFKECPHPDEKQRIELGRKISLDQIQIKFWFQNRRSQLKGQIEDYENTLLKEENERLKIEMIAVKNAKANPVCGNCGGRLKLEDPSTEEKDLRIQNARLKDEFNKVRALCSKFIVPLITKQKPSNTSEFVDPKSPLLDLAVKAKEEFIKMVQMGGPLWIKDIGSGKEKLNYETYMQVFPRCIGIKPAGFVYEATRETGTLTISCMELVETLMNAKQWAEMFPSMITSATVIDTITGGAAGTRDGALQLINAEFQILSPVVPIRDVSFLRYSKKLGEGVWVVVDVSVNGEFQSAINCRRLPSGVFIQDMPNGYSKVTWVEHTEYDATAVHKMFRPMLRSGMGLGAQCWISALQRRWEGLGLTVLLPPLYPYENAVITEVGKRNIIKLAQRMVHSFCASMTESASRKWTKFLGNANIGGAFKVMSKKSVNVVGEPEGIIVSAARSVCLQVSPQKLFSFLTDLSMRSMWDILCNGNLVHETIHIGKGQDQGNAISFLHAVGENGDNSRLIIQETCTDASGSIVVYAPVDGNAIQQVMDGGDSTHIPVLPCGFAIHPDGTSYQSDIGGSLLTVAFQLLGSALEAETVSSLSVAERMNKIIMDTILSIEGLLKLHR